MVCAQIYQQNARGSFQWCSTRVVKPKRVRLESRFAGLVLGLKFRVLTESFYPFILSDRHRFAGLVPLEVQLSTLKPRYCCVHILSLKLCRLTYRILPTSLDNYHCTLFISIDGFWFWSDSHSDSQDTTPSLAASMPTFTSSHVPAGSHEIDFVAATSHVNKTLLYSDVISGVDFVPVAMDTSRASGDGKVLSLPTRLVGISNAF